jgi:alkylhydroperoxidase/carboxymuconolactone decarboxylase family protein YurZ
MTLDEPADKGWSDQWVETLGQLPPAIDVLRSFNLIVEESHRDMRTWFFEDRPDGLTKATKELLIMVIDTIIGNTNGAVDHLRIGMRDGVTLTQVREALTLCFMMRGIHNWMSAGNIVWSEAARLDEH